MSLRSDDRFCNSLSPEPPLPAVDIRSLQDIVASNRSGRGVSTLSCPAFWEEAWALCQRARNVLIVTGFFIRSAAASETDGPPGAVVLGRTIALMGKQVRLATDRYNFSALASCSESIGGPSVLCLDAPDRSSLAETDLLIFLERPGRAGDGCYYNMRGEDISSVIVPLDDLALMAMTSGIPVLGIGDGGNEAGMGVLYKPLACLLPGYASFLSRVPSTVCLPVDVSNWGGYALSALLSVPFGRWTGALEGEEERMLEALRGQGAVDGISGRCGCSVDGFALSDLVRVSSRIRGWYGEQRDILP